MAIGSIPFALGPIGTSGSVCYEINNNPRTQAEGIYAAVLTGQSARDYIRESKSDAAYEINSLVDSFKYSKSQNFTSGTNIDVNSMSEFEGYNQLPIEYRWSRSEIATNNPIAIFPNDSIGYVNTSGTTGIIDAQYGLIDNVLYMISSTELKYYNSGAPASGAQSNIVWNISGTILTLSGGETFTTKLVEIDDYVFVGTSTGNLHRLKDGAITYTRKLPVGILCIQRSSTDLSEGATDPKKLWVLCSNKRMYHSMNYGSTMTDYAIGANLAEPHVRFAPNEMSGYNSIFLETTTRRVFYDDDNFGDILPLFFGNPYPRYSGGTRLKDGYHDVPFTAHGKVTHFHRNRDYWEGLSDPPGGYGRKISTPFGAEEVYVPPSSNMILYEEDGVKEYYSGWVLLTIRLNGSSPSGYILQSLLPNGKVLKNVSRFTLYEDGSIRCGILGMTRGSAGDLIPYPSDKLVNPASTSTYFAARLANSTFSCNPSFIALSKFNNTGSFNTVCNYSHYKITIDQSGSDWLSISGGDVPDNWYKNSNTIMYNHSANTSGKERFTWIHINDAENGRTIHSLGVWQSA